MWEDLSLEILTYFCLYCVLLKDFYLPYLMLLWTFCTHTILQVYCLILILPCKRLQIYSYHVTHKKN